MKTPIIIAAMLMFGCAHEPLTPEQVEWRHGIDRENWKYCMNILEGSPGSYSVHKEHITTRKNSHNRHWDIRSDLVANKCRSVLGKERWVDYGEFGKRVRKSDEPESNVE